jgi:hypothetical protein
MSCELSSRHSTLATTRVCERCNALDSVDPFSAPGPGFSLKVEEMREVRTRCGSASNDAEDPLLVALRTFGCAWSTTSRGLLTRRVPLVTPLRFRMRARVMFEGRSRSWELSQVPRWPQVGRHEILIGRWMFVVSG